MARIARGEQKTLLYSHEAPSADFVNQFKVSHKLSEALAAERKTGALGQSSYLQKKAQQGKYVEEARGRVKPPLPHVVEQQAMLSEIRRDAPMQVEVAVETPTSRERRSEKREAFLQSRKHRHENADDVYEKDMDALSERCKAEAQEAAKRMKRDVDRADHMIVEYLHPLEVDTERLGEKTEHEVQEVMNQLDDVIQMRRDRIEEFAAELERIEHRRREESTGLLKRLVESCTAAAHVVPGELERIVERKTLAVNEALLENKKASTKLAALLTVQTLEKSKENKLRWHKGLLLWKQKRHRHSVDQVMERIRSKEFRQPDPLVDLLARFREAQMDVYRSRKALLDECFATQLKNLATRVVRTWEEQNTSLNDNAQEAFDALLAEMKEAKDHLDIKAENMLSVLMQELETHDARQEWGEHESVNDLVNADIRPPLQDCLDIVTNLLTEVNEVFNHQEEVQHANCVKVLAWFLSMAKRQEQFKRGVADVEISYRSEIDEAVDHFRASCTEIQKKRRKLLDEDIPDSVHHDQLDELRTQAFELLDDLAVLYRDHAEETTAIHEGYPDRVADFFQPEAEGFCSDLGLITEAKVEEMKEAAAESGEPPPFVNEEGEPIDPQEWAEGAACKITIFERAPVPQVREKILGAAAPADEAPAGDEDKTMLPGAVDVSPVVAEEANEAGREAEPAEISVPRFWDGSDALIALQIEDDWLDERIEGQRRNVFEHLAIERDKLDEEDILGAIEKIRVELDHRLRKHTNLKGEVQVEYYLPRYTTISKHKDKFERHIIDIARKSQEHDEAVETLFEEVSTLETGYKEDLEALTTRFGDADSLPMLTKIQREALEKASKFKEVCQQIRTKLEDLAKKKPDALKKENNSFIEMCRNPEEKYGTSEITYYTTELNDLNSQLTARARERTERTEQLDFQLEDMRKVPYNEFLHKYHEAEEELCARKGLGRKHGEPRRNAQERCRKLNAWGAEARDRIDLLCKYFTALCEQPVDDVVDITALPACSLFNLGDVFRSQEAPWVFSAEVLGVFSILVCSLDAMATHLGAFKDEHSGKYTADNIKPVRLLTEGEAVAKEGDERAKGAEQDVRQECLSRVLGPVLAEKPYTEVIKSIVESSHQVYAGKGGTPEFMQTFLDKTVADSDRSRMEAAISIRDMCDELRESTLMKLGDAVFNELTQRFVGELRRRTREAQAVTTATWAESDAKRKAHEQALNPKLANPNNEKDLIKLVENEAERFDMALVTVEEDRVRMVKCLRDQADEYLLCLAARFEVALTVLDALPLHNHFLSLPGDEQVEAPRMSIKRRMRRMNSGQPVDECGDGLPKRAWTGLPRHELRSMLRNGTWPEDPMLAEMSPEALESERTSSVDSFRSPVHREIYDKRRFYYERFKDEFEAEVTRRSFQIEARIEKEKVGDKVFGQSARQLGPEVVNKVLEERRQRIEAEKEAAAAAAAAAAEAAAPPAKGGKKK